MERRRGVDVEEESDIDIDGSSADSLGLSNTEDSERGESDAEIITEEGNWTKNLKDFDNFVEFTSPVGPKKSQGEDASEIDFFELLFPKEMYAHISTETNKYALHKRHPPLVPDNDWYPTTVEEIKLYLGIRYIRYIEGYIWEYREHFELSVICAILEQRFSIWKFFYFKSDVEE